MNQQQPTIEQFARLDEKTAGAIKNLGEKMEAWAKSFDAHVEEDRQLRHDFMDQQRKFDRMVLSLEAISKQLADISHGFSSTVQESTKAMAVLRADVEILKVERTFRERELSRKDTNVKRWIGIAGVASSAVAVIVGHYWR